ncbi:hypothetical protein PR048_007606 [Dryococelus australis]|uniref:Uncharacterized protein n=1 Tax=Dryococelus australis TaxID=614101 RepID=A0ABQ9HUP4_9NEOP|nr:hypothetical protein PR048_007606 [Dryococelus australis]
MLLLHLMEKCMDRALRKQWELVVRELDIPKLSDFTDFFLKHCMSSEIVVGTSQKYSQPKSIDNPKGPDQHRRSCHPHVPRICAKGPSGTFFNDKGQMVMYNSINCLQAAHQVKSFPSTKSCRFCNARLTQCCISIR